MNEFYFAFGDTEGISCVVIISAETWDEEQIWDEAEIVEGLPLGFQEFQECAYEYLDSQKLAREELISLGGVENSNILEFMVID